MNDLPLQEPYDYREEAARRARGQFRIAGWVGLLGAGLLAMSLALGLGGVPIIPVAMIGVGLVFYVRGIASQKKSRDDLSL